MYQQMNPKGKYWIAKLFDASVIPEAIGRLYWLFSDQVGIRHSDEDSIFLFGAKDSIYGNLLSNQSCRSVSFCENHPIPSGRG